jgi:hypothetical protein
MELSKSETEKLIVLTSYINEILKNLPPPYNEYSKELESIARHKYQ